jgi:hypothetical protein
MDSSIDQTVVIINYFKNKLTQLFKYHVKQTKDRANSEENFNTQHKKEKKRGTSQLRRRTQHTLCVDGRDGSMMMMKMALMILINKSSEPGLFLKKVVIFCLSEI